MTTKFWPPCRRCIGTGATIIHGYTCPDCRGSGRDQAAVNEAGVEAMRTALAALITSNEEWKSLADSGDAGSWKAEEQRHYQKSVAAIDQLRATLD